jgi:transketolase
LTVEDHGIVGGLGSAVVEALSEVPDVTVRIHGVRTYGESGKGEDLFARHRLDAPGIAAVAKEFVCPDSRSEATG